MSQLIETIRLHDGVFSNLIAHEARMSRSLQEAFDVIQTIDLNAVLAKKDVPAQGLYKCRVIYSAASLEIAFTPYVIRPVSSLRLVVDNSISYPHKFQDRTVLEDLFSQKDTCDDILIIKNGMVTDTSYANIVFKKHDEWVTPASYLLSGTQRQALLQKGIIREEEIKAVDLNKFTKFKLINAMLLFEGAEGSIENIIA